MDYCLSDVICTYFCLLFHEKGGRAGLGREVRDIRCYTSGYRGMDILELIHEQLVVY